MDDLNQVVRMLGEMTEEERARLLRAIDGPPRSDQGQVAQQLTPIPTSGGSSRVVVRTRVVRLEQPN